MTATTDAMASSRGVGPRRRSTHWSTTMKAASGISNRTYRTPASTRLTSASATYTTNAIRATSPFGLHLRQPVASAASAAANTTSSDGVLLSDMATGV